MFNKLKDLRRFNKRKGVIIDLTAIKNKLDNGLFEVMEASFKKRKSNPDNSNFTSEEVDAIIEGYAKRNMILAAASSIVPGPLGILGSIPELLINFGNQMNMIYDLGCAYNKESFVTKDLLIDIPFAAFGGNTNLATIQNYNENLSDSSKEVLQEKIKSLGKSIIEKNLKKSIIQFVPITGPVLMGVWAKMTTSKVANISKSFFNQNTTYEEPLKKEATAEISSALQVQKIKGLANLIESNNDINEAQISFIGPIIENADLPESQKRYLLEESLKTGSNFPLDYQLLRDYEEEENFILEMVVMANRSGSIDELEKRYIFEVANKLALDKSFVENLFT